MNANVLDKRYQDLVEMTKRRFVDFCIISSKYPNMCYSNRSISIFDLNMHTVASLVSYLKEWMDK